MMKIGRPSEFALQSPDSSDFTAKAVEMFLQLADAICKETNEQFVINTLFGAVITYAHDHGADPYAMQTAFRKMAEMVPQVYAQRDVAKKRSVIQ